MVCKSQEAVWWAMTHSIEEWKQAEIVAGYFDESGTDDCSPIAVVGGILLTKSGFMQFDTKWRKILSDHHIPFVHMKEFGKHGRLGHLNKAKREQLFRDVVPVINKFKLISSGAILSHEEYVSKFAMIPKAKEQFGFYGMCFLLSRVITQKVAENSQYNESIPYLMDQGNSYAEHVRKANAIIDGLSPDDPLYLSTSGGLSFENDERILSLQAADVVSWTVRRKQKEELDKGFQPLEGLFDKYHVERGWKPEWIDAIAKTYHAETRKQNPYSAA